MTYPYFTLEAHFPGNLLGGGWGITNGANLNLRKVGKPWLGRGRIICPADEIELQVDAILHVLQHTLPKQWSHIKMYWNVLKPIKTHQTGIQHLKSRHPKSQGSCHSTERLISDIIQRSQLSYQVVTYIRNVSQFKDRHLACASPASHLNMLKDALFSRLPSRICVYHSTFHSQHQPRRHHDYNGVAFLAWSCSNYYPGS